MCKIVEEFSKDRSAATTVTRDTSPRWTAPELMEAGAVPNSKSDVWSFGMAILEVVTGEHPFHECRNQNQIYIELGRGKTPARPLQKNIWIDPVWSLLEQCWQIQRPELRPDMSKVCRRLLEAGTVHETQYPATVTEI
ncbi:uncharacterized protein PHACADRAFT_254196 [Phanerochaete carnosa HHB-10118-sp]|uniref:Protein kinase domain-containing protein n=1 Tax=Phanerochaete carnosa (strain HHB-10118-sp) TaxID=650164 RepID=K5WCY1_PHACS|nr:uncharacterized protein PHACADRAFT_254196 [Phanerochaete carnosa HHB-10118-sp]EKM56849.1 hypothetical protein PHACADRAFT_254196 [Phanerochaete carnosa HHB-10118-sp]